MNEDERRRVVGLLKDSRDSLLALVDPMTDEQWSYRENDDRWSVSEIVEHLGIVERNLFGQMKKALENPVNPSWREATAGKTELIERILLDRSQTREAPLSSRPTAALVREDALYRYSSRRATTLAFTEESEFSLVEYTRDHFRPIYGTLNAYQWLLYVPLHNLRHNQQVAEIAASSNFQTLGIKSGA